MSLRKVHDFWLRWKPLPKMMNIFLGHFWIFELNHIVFDFGHLNTINNLNAQINVGKLLGVTEIIQKTPITVSRIL